MIRSRLRIWLNLFKPAGYPASPPPNVEPVTGRRALVVVGMHRSGTSAMTRILSIAGAALPARLMPSAPSNPTGHWESTAIADFNDHVLSSLEARWDDPYAAPAGISGHPDLESWIETARDLLKEEYASVDMIVLKDPRISLLLDLWRVALAREGYQVAYIYMIRNPEEVAASLSARNGIAISEGRSIWHCYMQHADAGTSARVRVDVRYDEILGYPESVLHRINSRTGFGLSTDESILEEARSFVRPDLRHHAADDRQTAADDAETLYRRFQQGVVA